MSRQRLLAAAAVAAAHVLGALAETPDTFARVRSLAGAAGFESQQVLSELDAGRRRVEDFPLLAAVLAPDARYNADEVNTAFLWKTEPELEALLGGDDPLPPAGLLGFKPPAGGGDDGGAAGPLGAAASPPPRSLLEAGAAAGEDDLPKAFDNRKKVFTYNTDCRTPVGEQGCNDCAVFAAVDSVAWRSCILQRRWETEEGWTGKATTGAPRISKQTGNDCILKKCRGVGATADDVFSAWLKSDGWRSDSCLPYRVPTFGKCDGKCTATGAASKKKADYDTRFEIVSHETIRFPKGGGKLTKAEAIKATKRALKEGGPVYASFEFPYFPLMFHGKNKKSPKHINILDAPVVRGKPKDGSRPVGHAVMIVGWGKGASGAEYWIVRNQWGTGWGWNGDGFVATSADYVRYVSFATPKLRHRAEQKEFYEAYVARGDQALRSYAELVTRGAGLVERLAETLAKVPAALRPHTGTVYQKLASTLSRLDAAVKAVAGADKRHADRCAAFFGFLERTDSETRLMNADSAGRAQWKTAAAGGTACEDSVEKAVALFENRFRQAVGALLWLHADTANQGAHYLGVLTRVFGADCQKQKAKNLCGDKYFKSTNKWMNHLWKMERKKEMASLKLLAEKTYGFELILVMMDASKGTRSGGDWLRHRRYASSTDKAMATCRWLAGACCARYTAAKGCQ